VPMELSATFMCPMAPHAGRLPRRRRELLLWRLPAPFSGGRPVLCAGFATPSLCHHLPPPLPYEGRHLYLRWRRRGGGSVGGRGAAAWWNISASSLPALSCGRFAVWRSERASKHATLLYCDDQHGNAKHGWLAASVGALRIAHAPLRHRLFSRALPLPVRWRHERSGRGKTAKSGGRRRRALTTTLRLPPLFRVASWRRTAAMAGYLSLSSGVRFVSALWRCVG